MSVSHFASVEKPWLNHFGAIPKTVEIPNISLYDKLLGTTRKHPTLIALDYMGTTFTFAKLLRDVDVCAQAFLAMGVRRGDAVTLSLPNTPNTIMLFFALNKIGAIACMTHPLSSVEELKHYISITGSRCAVTIDLFFGRFQEILESGMIEKLVICHISDYLSPLKKAGFRITKGRKINPVPVQPNIIQWKAFYQSGVKSNLPSQQQDPKDGSVVLFSGGTTELPKGILLSSYNFNALAAETEAITGFAAGDSVLGILPVFHGFGLGLCVHTCMTAGGTVILVPEFSAKNYIANLIKHKPTHIAGVPTLFEALMRDPNFAKVDFRNLKGAYSGGDSLYPGIKKRFDEMIRSQGSKVDLKEGYGLTETVTACVISPENYKENSVGLPLPNMLAKVVKPDTEEELGYGEDGEICISGPTLMVEYLKSPEETAKAIRTHADGVQWLHTGDLGYMDSDGYLYFKNRIKRVLKVSGMSVYPAQVEQVLENHPSVFKACVIGVPDDYQMTSIKAFVVLNQPSDDVDKTKAKADILAHCHKHLIKWSVPRAIEFRETLPTTLVGKVAYTKLEQEELAKVAGDA